MTKPTVGVFFGSRSTEHDISIVTALGSVIKPLQLSDTYDVLPVYIAKDGRWFASPELADIKLFSSGKIADWLAKHKPVQLLFDHGLTLAQPTAVGFKKYGIDIAFPATHGTHGEDGELMGVFEMAGIPYVGCKPAASAIAMDKVLAKQIAAANAIATSPFVSFSKHDFEADPKPYLARIQKLTYPLFVKPAHLGSSIGISRVKNAGELQNAIEVALHYDTLALVEEAVPNLVEVTLPIMGNDEPTPALLERPLTHAEDFFDFETKYLQGGKKGGKGGSKGASGAQGYSEIPADLPKSLYAQAVATGIAVYKAIGASGLARVDMLIDSKKDVVYFNEVNPLPGSLYAHNWARAGVSGVELVSKLVDLALERAKTEQQSELVFSTNYLQQY